MNEATCKAALCKELRARLDPARSRVYRHEDQFTAGIPDISITANERTVWVEVKLNRPGRRGKVTELQRAALLALGGLLLTFEEGKDGTFSARLETPLALGGPVFESRKKSVVYREVAGWLLGRVA